MQNVQNPSGENYDPQKIIGGRYYLVEQLGKGSFGEVFKAKDIEFSPPRWVAIKFLHSQFLADPGVREDIKHEAGVLARFNHPNILRVIDFKVSKDIAYIVTDLAEGGSLAGRLRPDPTKPPTGLPMEEVTHLLEQMADGIDEAHSEGLVHRDLKPLNILLDKRGRALIADFGLATALSHSQSSVLVDASSTGTPPYMAPEQWMGRAGKATDIYALAAMTYQLITGLPPFMGGQMELMGQHLNVPVPPLNERAPNLNYPPALDKVIADAMAKDPAQRTKPAMEFFRRFKAALQTTPNNPAYDPTIVAPKPAPPTYGQPPTVYQPSQYGLPPAINQPAQTGFQGQYSNHPQYTQMDQRVPPDVTKPNLTTKKSKFGAVGYAYSPILGSIIVLIYLSQVYFIGYNHGYPSIICIGIILITLLAIYARQLYLYFLIIALSVAGFLLTGGIGTFFFGVGFGINILSSMLMLIKPVKRRR